MEVRGVATYSRFRRFQVSTSEELAIQLEMDYGHMSS